jgi:membrane-associated protein
MERFGKAFGIGMREIEHFEKLFHTHDTKILLISKLTMGFGFAFATLAGAGAAKVPFKKYFIINLVGGLVWTGILIFIGYFFGNLYFSISENMRIGFVAAGVAIAIGALYFFARYARARIKELN